MTQSTSKGESTVKSRDLDLVYINFVYFENFHQSLTNSRQFLVKSSQQENGAKTPRPD